MNLKNTEQAARLMGGELRSNASGVLTLTLADRDQIVFAKPTIDTTTDEPEPGDEAKEPRLRRYVEHDAIGLEVNRVLWSVARMAQEAQRVAQDSRYTDAGRADVLREPTRVGAINIADASRRVDEYEVGLLERETALFAVPVLPPHDAVGALLDREAREWARSLRGADRAAMLAKLSSGEAERVTLALLRSPIPLGPEERIAQQAFRAAVQRRNPDAVQQIAAETEHVQAARLLMKRAAAKFAEKAKLSGYPLFEAAASELTLPNGPSVFFSDPGEVRQYRIRWQTLQQKAA